MARLAFAHLAQRSVLVMMGSLAACNRSTIPSVPAPEPRGWMQYASPADAGYSAAALDSVRAFADSSRAGAVMVIDRGRVIAAWGDITRKFQLHSVRKSLVSSVYGIAVEGGKIDLDATLGDLGIDDVGKLTAQEKTARIRDLIAARSGVYLPGAYGGAEQAAERPARGAFAPGTHWFYNNWDFNMAGVLYERLTGENLYEAFGRRIAAPIGMEDYDMGDGFLVLEPMSSTYPAHTFRMSTRDLARFGQLYLQRGAWNGRQVVPSRWIAESTTPVSRLGQSDGFREGTGYGYMWWTYEPGTAGDRLPTINRRRVIVASGTGGQALFVIPESEIVIVVRGDTDNGAGVAGGTGWRIADGILRAKTGGGAGQSTAFVGVTPVPFASQRPAPAPLRVLTLGAAARAEYVGTYRVRAPEPARVYEYEGRLFGYMPGMGETELVAIARDRFTIRGQSDASLVFERNAAGAITSMRVSVGGREVSAERLP